MSNTLSNLLHNHNSAIDRIRTGVLLIQEHINDPDKREKINQRLIKIDSAAKELIEIMDTLYNLYKNE